MPHYDMFVDGREPCHMKYLQVGENDIPQCEKFVSGRESLSTL